MRRVTAAFLVVIMVAGAACVPLAATDSSARTNGRLKALLEEGVARGYPGMAMRVEDGAGHVWKAAAGYSDLEHRLPMTVDSGFHVASINKTVTAAATLHLVDEGKVSLSATLNDVLGSVVARIPNADRITVAELLDHSSGIYATNNDMDYLTTLLGPRADPHRVWTPAEMIALADKDRQPPAGEPGSGHYYADTNYVLLGMIVEKVSGVSFRDYIRKLYFEPLRMDSTFFYSNFLAGRVQPRMKVTQGYLLATNDIRSVIDINPMFKPVPGQARDGAELLNTTLAAERVDAAGGIVTTLDDLAKFAEPLFHGRLVSAQSQEFLMAALQGADELPADKHRVWTLQAMNKPYGVVIYKEGDGPGGVNTLMAYLPQQNEIFIGFSNSFGYFDEVDFMMDQVIGPWVSRATP